MTWSPRDSSSKGWPCWPRTRAPTASSSATGPSPRLSHATAARICHPCRSRGRASLLVALFSKENPVHRATLEGRPVTAFLRYLIPINSGFLRRSAIGAARFSESLRQGEDTCFWISLAAAGRRFVLDEHAYAVVRRHAGNATRFPTRYLSEIQPCYERLLCEGLLAASDDVFLAHLKLLWFKTLTGGKGAGRHLQQVVASPRLLAAELRFWTANLVSRLGRPTREL